MVSGTCGCVSISKGREGGRLPTAAGKWERWRRTLHFAHAFARASHPTFTSLPPCALLYCHFDITIYMRGICPTALRHHLYFL